MSSAHLLEAVLCGNIGKSKTILEINPKLLLNYESAIDFSGRSFTGTAFQAALCTGDIEMAQMIREYFTQVSLNVDFMHQQFKELFPKGLESHWTIQAQNTYDFTSINHAIIHASSDEIEAALTLKEEDSRLYRELNQFRETFTKHTHNEKVFNPQHVLRAYEFYDKFWEKIAVDDVRYSKRTLFWRQILGFTQRFLPACDAQAFAYGLYDIVAHKHVCPRSFNFRFDSSQSFYPLQGECLGIGFDVAAISGAGRGAPFCLMRGGSRLYYQKYIEQKNQMWKTYEEANPEMSESVCKIV